MAVWQFIGVLLVAVAAQAAKSSRIVGGSVVDIEDYPSIAQVEFNNAGFFWYQQCAGSILNNLYILSAAHCFSGPNYEPSTRRVRVGAALRNEGGIVAGVETAFNHPTFGENENDGDITVVRLSAPLPIGGNVQQALLMAPGFVLPAGFDVTYVGWGQTSVESTDFSEQLSAVDTVIVDRELCRLSYSTLTSNPPVTENMVCAGNFGGGGQDACVGDGGGPLYFNNILTGVISWGNGCGHANFPGVSTQVSSYTNWIIQTAV